MRTKINRFRGIGKAFWTGFLIIGLFTGLCAQEKMPVRSSVLSHVLQGAQAKSVPDSNSKITMRFTFDNGVWFDVTQLEGRTISLEKDGAKTGFIATQNENGVSLVAFDMFAVKDQSKVIGEALSVQARFEMSLANPGAVWSDLGVKIELLNIEKTPRVEKTIHHPPASVSPVELSSRNTEEIIDRSPPRPMRAPGDDLCCVTCQGITMCGCAVSTPCGSCCVGTCCV